MELALEAGADDIVTEPQGFTVYTTQQAFEPVREALKKAGIEPDEAEVKKLADNNIALEGTKAQQLLKLIEMLDDHDDVSSVWDNSDISEAEMEAAAAG
jgi:transcriptional/translational regulatory protein YebC/TACO1